MGNGPGLVDGVCLSFRTELRCDDKVLYAQATAGTLVTGNDSRRKEGIHPPTVLSPFKTLLGPVPRWSAACTERYPATPHRTAALRPFGGGRWVGAAGRSRWSRASKIRTSRSRSTSQICSASPGRRCSPQTSARTSSISPGMNGHAPCRSDRRRNAFRPGHAEDLARLSSGRPVSPPPLRDGRATRPGSGRPRCWARHRRQPA